jgi:hypothetical protein
MIETAVVHLFGKQVLVTERVDAVKFFLIHVIRVLLHEETSSNFIYKKAVRNRDQILTSVRSHDAFFQTVLAIPIIDGPEFD